MTRWQKWLLLSACGIVLTLLSGCWDAVEMNRIGIVLATGFDYDPEEKMYEVTITSLEPGPAQGGGQPVMQDWTVSAKSTNVFDAVEKIRTRSHNELTWKHCQLFVFHAGLSQEVLKAIGDWLMTMTEIRSSAYIIFTPTQAKTFLTAKPEQEEVLGLELYGIFYEQSHTGIAAQATLQDLFISASSPSYTCVAARGEIVHDFEQKPVTVLYGSAIVRDYKHVGWFEPEETLGYYFARGLPHDGVFTAEANSQTLVVETTRNKSNIRPYYDNGKLRIQLNVDVHTRLANIINTPEHVPDPAPPIIRETEKAQEEAIRQLIQKMLDKSKALKVDVLDIAEAVYRFDPDYYRKHIHNWKDLYPQIPIDIRVTARVRDKGRDQKPLTELRGGKM